MELVVFLCVFWACSDVSSDRCSVRKSLVTESTIQIGWLIRWAAEQCDTTIVQQMTICMHMKLILEQSWLTFEFLHSSYHKLTLLFSVQAILNVHSKVLLNVERFVASWALKFVNLWNSTFILINFMQFRTTYQSYAHNCRCSLALARFQRYVAE